MNEVPSLMISRLSSRVRAQPSPGIAELADPLEAVDVVDEANLVGPGQLVQPPLPVDDALAEIAAVDDALLLGDAGFEVPFADERPTGQARALEDEAVPIEQALGKGVRVVRVALHDRVAAYGRRGREGWRADRERGREKQTVQATEQRQH
jgi:hypothetical protein